MDFDKNQPFFLFELMKSDFLHQQVMEGKTVNWADNTSQVVTDIQMEHYIEFSQKINKLVLCCQAMWELLQAKTDLTESDLNQKVTEIDIRDGAKDNFMTVKAKKCPRCDSMISIKFQRCLFCGYEDHETSPLKSV